MKLLKKMEMKITKPTNSNTSAILGCLDRGLLLQEKKLNRL